MRRKGVGKIYKIIKDKNYIMRETEKKNIEKGEETWWRKRIKEEN